jgi:hypothetical protein
MESASVTPKWLHASGLDMIRLAAMPIERQKSEIRWKLPK